MRVLPNFVGGFVRSSKVAFLIDLVGIRISRETELMKSLEVRRPTEESLFEDFLEVKQYEAVQDPHMSKMHARSIDGMLMETEGISAFVDIALALYRQEAWRSAQDLAGLKKLQRYIESDVPAAIELLEKEIMLLEKTRDSMKDFGADGILTAYDGDGRRRHVEKTFDDEIAFLGMLLAVLRDVSPEDVPCVQ